MQSPIGSLFSMFDTMEILVGVRSDLTEINFNDIASSPRTRTQCNRLEA